jgi:secreted PhoX family phosphatase
VKWGLNVSQSAFQMPDNLALDHDGNLFITEDPGGSFPTKTTGDDIWMAVPPKAARQPATSVLRFATLTDCVAEPTGLYVDLKSNLLFVNVQQGATG